MVAEAVAELDSASKSAIGMTSVPPRVPPERVIVKVALAVLPPLVKAVRGTLAVNVPLAEIAP
jgi:hypothetical protein